VVRGRESFERNVTGRKGGSGKKEVMNVDLDCGGFLPQDGL
jgi:hypothetical protein